MEYEVLTYDSPKYVEKLSYQAIISDVDMGEWRAGRGELSTTGASTCIVLAAHNTESRAGLLGHFTAISEPNDTYANQHKFIEALGGVLGLGDPEKTSIWIGGGAPYATEKESDSVEPDRAFAQAKVVELAEEHSIPFTQLRADWSGPKKVIDVQLDCPEAKLYVHRYPDISMDLAELLMKSAVRRDDSSGDLTG